MSSGIPEGKLKLGRALLSGGLITREVLEGELEKSNKGASKMGKALLNCNFPREEDLIQVIAQSIRVPNVRIQSLKISTDTVGVIPRALAEQHKVLALEQIGGILVVVTPDIGNHNAFAAVRQETGCFVAPIRCPEEGFDEAIEKFYADVKAAPKAAATSSASAGSSTSPVKETSAAVKEDKTPAAATSGGRADPEALLPIPADEGSFAGDVAVNPGYYDVVSLFEHLYTKEGPIYAETVE